MITDENEQPPPPEEELTIQISREDTPSGVVVYREYFDRQGKVVRRDVEHLISILLSAQGASTQDSGD